LSALQAALFEYADSARSLSQLVEFASHSRPGIDATAVRKIVAPLVHGGCMMQEGNLFLSLAVSIDEGYVPRSNALKDVLRSASSSLKRAS
jgi:hypothetical protein